MWFVQLSLSFFNHSCQGVSKWVRFTLYFFLKGKDFTYSLREESITPCPPPIHPEPKSKASLSELNSSCLLWIRASKSYEYFNYGGPSIILCISMSFISPITAFRMKLFPQSGSFSIEKVNGGPAHRSASDHCIILQLCRWAEEEWLFRKFRISCADWRVQVASGKVRS